MQAARPSLLSPSATQDLKSVTVNYSVEILSVQQGGGLEL